METGIEMGMGGDGDGVSRRVLGMDMVWNRTRDEGGMYGSCGG